MQPVQRDEYFERLRTILMPILADAAIGRFDHNVPFQGPKERELNEILMGVQVLLEVVRQQQRQLQESEARLVEAQARLDPALDEAPERVRSDRKPL